MDFKDSQFKWLHLEIQKSALLGYGENKQDYLEKGDGKLGWLSYKAFLPQ